jgi:cytochrome subunit of sulfide dehydrogenase
VNFAPLRQLVVLAAACAASLAYAQTAPAASAAVAAPAKPRTPAEQALYVRSLAATCANCHGTEGRAPEGSAVVSLAGQPKDYIVAQMQAFKSGARPATIMHQLSKGYSNEQVEAIAAYFAAQKK